LITGCFWNMSTLYFRYKFRCLNTLCNISVSDCVSSAVRLYRLYLLCVKCRPSVPSTFIVCQVPFVFTVYWNFFITKTYEITSCSYDLKSWNTLYKKGDNVQGVGKRLYPF
jgi:hypothetical protein